MQDLLVDVTDDINEEWLESFTVPYIMKLWYIIRATLELLLMFEQFTNYEIKSGKVSLAYT